VLVVVGTEVKVARVVGVDVDVPVGVAVAVETGRVGEAVRVGV
jgi:hypothetical protein